MRYILTLITSVLLCASMALGKPPAPAPQRPIKPVVVLPTPTVINPVKPVVVNPHNPNIVHPHTVVSPKVLPGTLNHPNYKYHYGYTYNGHTHSHPYYKASWRNFTQYYFDAGLGVYFYWCPIEETWYWFDGTVFIAVE